MGGADVGGSGTCGGGSEGSGGADSALEYVHVAVADLGNLTE